MKKLFKILMTFFIVAALASNSIAAGVIPKNSAIYYGDLPAYFSPPLHHDVGMGYKGNNIRGMNKSGKNVLEWVYDMEFSSLSDIIGNTQEICSKNGFKVGVASNVKIELTTPLDSVYLFLQKYEINCW